MTDDIPVILKDLPPSIKGFTCLGSDYNPIIVINSRLPYELQWRVYLHEYMHIKSGQIDNDDYREYGA